MLPTLKITGFSALFHCKAEVDSMGNILQGKTDTCRRTVSLHGKIHRNSQKSNNSAMHGLHTQHIAWHTTASQQMMTVLTWWWMVAVHAFAMHFLKLKKKKSPRMKRVKGYSNYSDHSSVLHRNRCRQIKVCLFLKNLTERNSIASLIHIVVLQPSARPGLGKLR